MPTKDYKRDHLLPRLREHVGEAAEYIAANLRDNADSPDSIALAFQDVADAYGLPIDVSARGATWQPIETAPRKVTWGGDGHGYGPHILAWPVFYEVARVQWWESKSGGHNFLEDGGNAVHPSHWMPLPAPPEGNEH